MKPLQPIMSIALAILASGAQAQLQLVSNSVVHRVFAGDARNIPVMFSNTGSNTIVADLRTRLVQVSSATTVTIGEAAWKQLLVLSGQTVLETVTLNFPDVRAETRFIIRWQDGKNKLIGTTEVMVYPTNLLNNLKLLAGENPVGVFDPENQIKPLLKICGVEFANLENDGITDYSGRLTIVGPFRSEERQSGDLEEQIQSLGKKNIAVVWLQPPTKRRGKPQPSFYSVPFGEAAVVIAQQDTVASLADNPQAQLNLVYYCNLALHPEPFRLPHMIERP